MRLMRERVTVVWVALMVATCASTWTLAETAPTPGVAVTGIFLIAALKVRYIMLDFMELREAPIPTQVAFQLWIVGVTLIILGFWFATPR